MLLRAAEPLTGLEEMRARRAHGPDATATCCRGPARLCQAFGLDGAFDGADLPDGRPRRHASSTTAHRHRTHPAVGTRIGLSAGAELPWRWCVPGDPHLSRPA